jgi:hypothetical protein
METKDGAGEWVAEGSEIRVEDGYMQRRGADYGDSDF